MLVDITSAASLDYTDYSSLPMLDQKASVFWKAGDADIRLLITPLTYAEDEIVFVKYALVASYKGEDKVCVSLELENLRSLAAKLSVSLKTLQNDYGTKGYLVSPAIWAYAEGERESYGECAGDLDEEAAVPLLMDVLLDVIDSGDDPERVD